LAILHGGVRIRWMGVELGGDAPHSSRTSMSPHRWQDKAKRPARRRMGSRVSRRRARPQYPGSHSRIHFERVDTLGPGAKNTRANCVPVPIYLIPPPTTRNTPSKWLTSRDRCRSRPSSTITCSAGLAIRELRAAEGHLACPPRCAAAATVTAYMGGGKG
jgi:hypothetical protein